MKISFVQRTQRSRGGFTLLELLVVMVIIGMLAAMVLPIIQRATAGGHNALCRNNLRTLHYGITSYVHDNDGVLPSPDHSVDQSGPTSRTHWILALTDELDLQRRGGASFLTLSCQAALNARARGRDRGAQTRITYGYNQRLKVYSSADEAHFRLRRSRVVAPDRTAMIMDGKNHREGPNAYWYHEVRPDADRRPIGMDFVHGEIGDYSRGRINVLSVAGNVSDISEERLEDLGGGDAFWNYQEFE